MKSRVARGRLGFAVVDVKSELDDVTPVREEAFCAGKSHDALATCQLGAAQKARVGGEHMDPPWSMIVRADGDRSHEACEGLIGLIVAPIIPSSKSGDRSSTRTRSNTGGAVPEDSISLLKFGCKPGGGNDFSFRLSHGWDCKAKSQEVHESEEAYKCKD